MSFEQTRTKRIKVKDQDALRLARMEPTTFTIPPSTGRIGK